MRDAAVPGAPLQPFADDAAGSGYFSSDHHHHHLADALVRHLAKGCNVVLVSGAPPADGELMARFLDEGGSRYRASVVACRSGMNFNDLMLAYSRQLGIGVNRDKGRLWALLSHLMLETRRGITRVLVLDHAQVLDALCFDELLRFSQLDAPRPVPIVLLAAPPFADLLTTPALDFVNAAITGRIAVDRLAPEEVGAFIQYQLNGLNEGGATPFSSELIALIATAADGNPAIINTLAREIVLSTKPRRENAVEPRAPEADPVGGDAESAETPPATAETNAVATSPATPPMASAEPWRWPPWRPGSAELRRWRLSRQGMDLQIAGYLALSLIIGGGLLYALTPGREPEVAPPSTALILPAAESAAMAALPSGAPKTAVAPATDRAPAETAPEAGDASAAAAPSVAESSAPSPAPLTAPSSENAAPPTPEPDSPSAAIEPADKAALAPALAPPATEPAASSPAPESADNAALAPAAAPPPAATERPATTANAPSPPSEALAAIEPEAAQPQSAAPPSAEVTVMLQRGDQLFAAGDIVSARQFYERAAASGNAAALCGVGKSFDPLVLRKIGVLGFVGDAAKAIAWYRKAAAAGSEEASVRLNRLAANQRPDSERR